MELRDIEIFLTLAEELHFGRTAERLHLTQARVSQAIKKQERLIGAALFDRTSRRVALTEVGRQLYTDLKPIRRSLDESLERAKLAAKGRTDVLHIGMISANALDLRHFWETFRARHRQWELRLRHNPFVDAFGPLRRREIDLLISWLPVEEPDLTVGPVIFTESRVIAVSADHELASAGPVPLEVLGNYTVAAGPRLPEYWEDAFHPFRTPRGRPIPREGVVMNMDELNTQIATGQAVPLLGEHASRYYARPDLAYLPVTDAPALRWGLVWRDNEETAPIRAFAQVVRDLGTRAL
ncbi:LysR family transcriptional regulator [Nonomuraea sp. NPDC050556]|uniref:LysR family transcriptional regulator n=1 Tax=Nonomuraea sp. NPDC050556 TaxID=3364369 RepID=UPI0037A90E68